jgi:hypothetical protein
VIDNQVTDAIVKSETPKRTRRTRRETQEMAEASYVPPDVMEAVTEAGEKLEKMGYDLEELEKDNPYNPYNPTVEIADLEPAIAVSQEDFINQCIANAKLTNKIAELHIAYTPDGTAQRVEFRGGDGITFVIPQIGDVKWVMFMGDIRQFPGFLGKLSVLDTISA